MTDRKIYRIAFTGICAALAILLGYVESVIPLNIGIPYFKLGLSNLATVICLYTAGPVCSLCVLCIRIVICSLLFGTPVSFIYSISGGLISFLAMFLLFRFSKFGMVPVSVFGGVFHNIGQTAVAVILFENIRLAYTLPVLLVFGVLSGLIIGIVSSVVLKYLPLGFSGKNE